jgi:hypothetical protein
VAVELLDTEDDINGTVESDLATFPYTLPDGTDKRLIVVKFIVATEGSSPYDPANFSVTYGGVEMTVKGISYPTLAQMLLVATVSTSGNEFAGSDIVLNRNAGNPWLLVTCCVRVFDSADPDDADMSFEYVSGSADASELELDPVTPEASGDLVYTVAVSRNSLTQPVGYTAGTETGESPFIRDAYSVTATGAQTLTWGVAAGSDQETTALAFVVRQADGGGGGCADFNCDCEEVSPYKTLAELRTECMPGFGYAAQAANPPPGMVTLIDFYLRQAQEFLWLRYKQVRCERFFRWTMVPGQRYYGIMDSENCCAVTIDPLKVTWVGFEDLNQTWVPLIEGIPPEFYTRAETSPGWPSHYEIRSCIEVFPAPQAAYSLWLKGHFGLAALTAPTDRTTIDDRAVLWMAIGMYREDTGKNGADRFKNMALQRIKDITSGQHNTARFVPRPGGQLPPMTPPRFLPLGDEPS